jgi:hypothetical protein
MIDGNIHDALSDLIFNFFTLSNVSKVSLKKIILQNQSI